jgi:hypothetical protein
VGLGDDLCRKAFVQAKMALSKSSRAGVGGSPSTYIITGSVLVGFFLVAVWVVSAPAAVPVHPQGAVALDTNNRPSAPINASSPNMTSTTEDGSLTKELAVDQAPHVSQEIQSAETQPTEQLPDIVSTQAELTTENKEAAETGFETQASESKEEKEVSKDLNADSGPDSTVTEQEGKAEAGTRTWKLCGFRNAQDFIPCLDNEKTIRKLRSRKHYEHRERHCQSEEELPKCLLPLPKDYKVPINWPMSRDQVSPLQTWCAI